MRKALSTRYPAILLAAAVAAVVYLVAGRVTAQSGAANGEWGVFGADAGATRYSPPGARRLATTNRVNRAPP